jgi:hypothetical protein
MTAPNVSGYITARGDSHGIAAGASGIGIADNTAVVRRVNNNLRDGWRGQQQEKDKAETKTTGGASRDFFCYSRKR